MATKTKLLLLFFAATLFSSLFVYLKPNFNQSINSGTDISDISEISDASDSNFNFGSSHVQKTQDSIPKEARIKPIKAEILQSDNDLALKDVPKGIQKFVSPVVVKEKKQCTDELRKNLMANYSNKKMFILGGTMQCFHSQFSAEEKKNAENLLQKAADGQSKFTWNGQSIDASDD